MPSDFRSPEKQISRSGAAGPLVLFYTPFFKEPPNIKICCDAPACWTIDRRRVREADIVVFHVPNFHRVRRVRKYPGQIWVAWSLESKVHYPQLGDPNYMRHFDIRMTYERDADVWTPYLPRTHEWLAIQQRPVPVKSETAPLAMFQSAGVDRSGRTKLASDLFRSMAIDSYGRLLRNRAIEGPDLGHRSKIDTLSRYWFYLAFENSIAPDYVTEKIFDALRAGTVPVYLGAPNVADFVPEDCFIDATAYGGAEELAHYLAHLCRHPDAYARYHQWRDRPLPATLLSWAESVDTEAFCRLLTVYAERSQRRHGPANFEPARPATDRLGYGWRRLKQALRR